MKVFALLLTLVFLLSMGGSAVAQQEPVFEPDSYRGEVLEVEGAEGSDAFGDVGGLQRAKIRILSGDRQGETLVIDNHLSGNPAYDLVLSPGDQVLVGFSGGDVFVMDFVRDRSLFIMAAVFALLLILVAGYRGFRAIVVLGLTGISIVYILIPLILSGYSPILVTLMISALVVSVGLLILTGFTVKTFAAAGGTVVGVVIAGLIARYFGDAAHLIGLHSQEAQMLFYTADLAIDYRGILFSGMLLGALGAIMDVCVSVASSVEEVFRANQRLSVFSLVRSGVNVGRDVLGTMSNTLILAYTGGALPLLLLLSANDMGARKMLNLDLIATEVVRALSGSIGLVICVPITAFIAAYFQVNRRSRLS